jgi:hypothetical protein
MFQPINFGGTIIMHYVIVEYIFKGIKLVVSYDKSSVQRAFSTS